MSLFDDLKELLNSEEFTSLEKYELCEGDSVCIDTEIYLDASTKAYYDKVVEFADKAQEVLNKWNNKFES